MIFLRLKVVAAFCAALAFSIGCLAQSDTAQISGFVRDASNAVVPNASVKLKHETTGLERTTVTNESGYYVVSSLPPGFYTIEVEAPGFKKFVKTQNKLDPSIPRTIDAQLDVGAVTEVVEVVASGAILQSETATVGKLIDSQQIGNMILNGRNPILLALLKPGVRGGSLQSFTFGLTSGGLSINGARTQDFLITFDGAVAIRTRANGTGIGAADVDSVQEIRADHNADLVVEGIVINQFQPRANLPQKLAQELVAEGLPVLRTYLSSSVKVKESHEQARPLVHLAPGHKLTQEYLALYQELQAAARTDKPAARLRLAGGERTGPQ